MSQYFDAHVPWYWPPDWPLNPTRLEKLFDNARSVFASNQFPGDLEQHKRKEKEIGKYRYNV